MTSSLAIPLEKTHPLLQHVMARRGILESGVVPPKVEIANYDDSLPVPNSDVKGRALTAGNAQGFHNFGQLLWDICDDTDLTSLSLAGQYSLIFDLLTPTFSNLDNLPRRHYLTYIGPNGTAADTPSTGIIDDACAPNVGSYEFGSCSYDSGGWFMQGRRGLTRDITQLNMLYCPTQPTVRLDGSPIEDDYEWDIVGATSVLMQDMHRYFLTGQTANPGENSGVRELITDGIEDAESGDPCPQLDPIVIDWNGQAMCPTGGATGVEVNGNGIDDGYNLIDIIEAWVRRIIQRIAMTPRMARQRPFVVCLTTTEALSCLIGCYVCRNICGSSDLTMMRDAKEAIAEHNKLLQELMTGAVTLPFLGLPITFIPFDYDTMHDPEDDVNEFIFMTLRLGQQRVWDLHIKDMRKAAARMKSGRYRAVDNGRLLVFDEEEAYCIRPNIRMDWRLATSAPWLNMRIQNVACDSIFGHLSHDPLSTEFLGAGNLRAGKFPAGAVSPTP